MRIGIVGAGRIGGNCAVQFAKGGHEVKLSSRDPSKLEPLAQEIGEAASVGMPAEAAEFGEVVVLSVPWDGIGDALERAGSLERKVIIDTTNLYGSVSPPAESETAGPAQRGQNARRPLHEELQHPQFRPSRPRRPSGRSRTERSSGFAATTTTRSRW